MAAVRSGSDERLLSARGLVKDFEGLRAVDGVDLDIHPHKIHGLIGPNGAGKTTLVSLLSGRLTPSAGAIQFDGVDVTRLPAHRRVALGIAYTFQITSIFGALSVRENVALAAQSRLLRARGLRGAALAEQTGAALERVGLTLEADQTARALSYGHQRLLEVAMGLALRPKLLILDEPTQGLAEDEIARLGQILQGVAQEAAVLVIEHNMTFVMTLADRITVLDGGKVLAEGDPAAIQADPAVRRAYLGA